ncbi:MAG: thioredoxin family protein [Candidatus Gribaldobacteria bacterium]|nr:thioredoxin family protein [Candidatus Gribaldobacteria bacterium]
MSNFFNLEKTQNLIIGVLLVAVVILAYLQFAPDSALPGQLSSKAAVDNAMSFINENVLKASPDKAQLSGQPTEEAGLYKFMVKVSTQEVPLYVSKDGNLLFMQPPANIKEEVAKAQAANATGTPATSTNPGATAPTGAATIGDFKITTNEVCLENGKPTVYFFGSEGCPHCRWEKPVIEKIAQTFSGLISFHENVDNNKDMDVFGKYSQGGIPTLVLGCKYFREGSGEQAGEAQETKDLSALLCKLTNGQPASVCSGVTDLINQIQ